jgi:hypothetical protein
LFSCPNLCLDLMGLGLGLPVYTLLTPASLCQADGWIVKRVELLSNPNSKHPSRFWGVYTKLTIFNLVEYERGTLSGACFQLSSNSLSKPFVGMGESALSRGSKPVRVMKVLIRGMFSREQEFSVYVVHYLYRVFGQQGLGGCRFRSKRYCRVSSCNQTNEGFV